MIILIDLLQEALKKPEKMCDICLDSFMNNSKVDYVFLKVNESS